MRSAWGCFSECLVEDNEDDAAAHLGLKLGAFGASTLHTRAFGEMLGCIDIAAELEDALPASAGAGDRKALVTINMVRLHGHVMPSESFLTDGLQVALLPNARLLPAPRS